MNEHRFERAVLWSALCAIGCFAACSSSPAALPAPIKDAPRPMPGADAMLTRDVTVPTTPDASDARADGGFDDDGGADGADEEAEPAPQPPDAGPPLCNPATTWGIATAVPPAASATDDRFAAITPDELTMVWMSVANQVPTLQYADRNAVTDVFGPSQTLPATADYYALDRVAVSPDGLRFVVVRSDRKGFGEFTRSARLHDFTTQPNEVSFSRINGLGKMLPAQELLGDPILSADDLSLYFSRYGGDAPGTIYESTRTGPVTWPIGAAVSGKLLQVVGTSRRRPTGVSFDRRTLFYWDEASGSERAAWRPALNWPFDSTKDLASRAEAQPNAACTKLYFSSDGTGGADVFVAPAN